MVSVLCVFLFLAGSGVVSADVPPDCRQAEQRYEDNRRRAEMRGPIKDSTEAALAEINKARLEGTIDDPVRARNAILDRDPPVRTKDQRLIVRRMVAVYCEVIFSQGSPGDAGKKIERLNKVSKVVRGAEPFEPVAVTGQDQLALRRGQPVELGGASEFDIQASVDYLSADYLDGLLFARNDSSRDFESKFLSEAPYFVSDTSEYSVMWASAPAEKDIQAHAAASGTLVIAQDDSSEESESEFLAEAPYFVNDTNKYFVILGSAGSKKAGIGMMNNYKKAAPQYDFALYPPYRGNPAYAVMIATWVSGNIAKKAQAEGLAVVKELMKDDFVAKRDTPYIWCYPYGISSCKPSAPRNNGSNSGSTGKKSAIKKKEAT